MEPSGEKKIQVCSSCKTASCWYGEFMCQDSKSADVELMTVSQLTALHREHPENWSDKKMQSIYGDPNPFGSE